MNKKIKIAIAVIIVATVIFSILISSLNVFDPKVNIKDIEHGVYQSNAVNESIKTTETEYRLISEVGIKIINDDYWFIILDNSTMKIYLVPKQKLI